MFFSVFCEIKEENKIKKTSMVIVKMICGNIKTNARLRMTSKLHVLPMDVFTANKEDMFMK